MKRTTPKFDKENGCRVCWLLVEIDGDRLCEHCAPVAALTTSPEKEAALDRILMGD